MKATLGHRSRQSIDKQVMWTRLISVVEEQAQALLRTAFGSVVREAGDLSAGVYDLKGQMLAQAVGYARTREHDGDGRRPFSRAFSG